MKRLLAALLLASLVTGAQAENAYTDTLVKMGMIDTYIFILGFPADGDGDPCKLGRFRKLEDVQEAVHVQSRDLRDLMSREEWYRGLSIGQSITETMIQQDHVDTEFCKVLREHATDLGVLK